MSNQLKFVTQPSSNLNMTIEELQKYTADVVLNGKTIGTEVAEDALTNNIHKLKGANRWRNRPDNQISSAE